MIGKQIIEFAAKGNGKERRSGEMGKIREEREKRREKRMNI